MSVAACSVFCCPSLWTCASSAESNERDTSKAPTFVTRKTWNTGLAFNKVVLIDSTNLRGSSKVLSVIVTPFSASFAFQAFLISDFPEFFFNTSKNSVTAFCDSIKFVILAFPFGFSSCALSSFSILIISIEFSESVFSNSCTFGKSSIAFFTSKPLIWDFKDTLFSLSSAKRFCFSIKSGLFIFLFNILNFFQSVTAFNNFVAFFCKFFA